KLNDLLVQKESELKTFLSVIDNMSEGVIVSDRFGFFTYYNQSALEIIGPQIKDLYYQSSLDQMGFHDLQGRKLEKIELPFHKAVNKNIVTDQEILVNNSIHPQGLYISASNGFFVDNKGDTLGAVVVMKNISHKKQLEELWKKEKEIAIEGSKKKSDFLASMSHEIRTPMNGIIGLTTLLSESQLDEQQSEFVSIIRRSAHSLLALINDILDHSKIESGKIELVKNNFDLKFLVKDVVENFKFSCAEKNNKIQVEYTESLNNYFLADDNRLRQILMNLVGNAVKFTSNGTVTVKIDILKDHDRQSQLRFSVTDTGPGMDKTELDRLFQRFFQTKTGIKFGGTGLGLSICKQLVDLMNGKIGVESQSGVGSTFWFNLDLEKGINELNKSKNIKLSDFANTFSGHVLVAEDNIINQKVIFQYLTKLGFTVDIVNNGAEAVDSFEKNLYDLILMDCNMPVLNGYEATKKINEIQSQIEKRRQIKIIALTAEGQITGKSKCLDAGMSDFINKPILIEEFISVLKKYCSNFQKTSLHKLKELSVGDQLLIEVLLEEYSQSTPAMIASMAKSYDIKDFESLSDTAHSLKSASGALGARKVQSLCQIIEDIKLNPDLINIKNVLLDLENEFKISLIEIQHEIHLIKSSVQKASA
ncbi:MAG: response regulator, partial [Moraxellaceae bacterium]|nr:response regulator [Pseudobdellovibrionaceae bacterium]